MKTRCRFIRFSLECRFEYEYPIFTPERDAGLLPPQPPGRMFPFMDRRMQHPRFLLDEAMSEPGMYVLNAPESHHAVNVLRLRPDDAVIVFDGRGRYAEAAVVTADKNAVRVRVDDVRHEPHLAVTLTIATAIPKGKRWQTLVEKCTELGVDRLAPLLSARSVVKGEGDIGKWRRWVIEAAKQSRRSWLPEIREPAPLSAVLDAAAEEGAALLLADPEGNSPHCLWQGEETPTRITALVGPEGGFNEEETAECMRRGALPVRLSPFTLRIETAAAALCAIAREFF